MASGIVIKGIDEMAAKLNRLAARVPVARQFATLAWAQSVLVRAQQLCPVGPDTKRGPGGTLKASGYAAAKNGNAVVGFTADYALAVHERTWVRHAIGQARYLAQALEEHRGNGALGKVFWAELGK